MNLQSIGFLIFSLFLGPSLSYGALTLSAVGGASANSENFLTIYGGLGGTCSTTSSVSTCNSCTGTGTGFEICNQRRIHDSLSLTLSFSINTADSAGTGVRFSLVQSTDNAPVYESGLTDVAINTTYTASIPWSQICSNFGVTCSNPGAAVNTSKTFYFGVDKNLDGIPDEASRVTLTIRLMNPDPAAQQSNDCGTTNQAGQGLCFFTVERGDEKVFISDFAVADDYPAVAGASGNTFVAAYFYFGEFITDAATTIASIKNNFSSIRIPITAGTSGSAATLTDNRITGLENGIQYCFVAVNEDIAGNLFRASALTTGVCATPEPVVGLLDDKNCFIATASFGDSDQQPVVILRQFRDRFLKTNILGQKLVDFYYSVSPTIAEVIAENPILKTLVKWALVPAVVFADLMLAGSFVGVFLILMLGLSFWFFRKQKVQV